MLGSPAAANGFLNINCTDPLGRSALLMAIDNENLEMVELLLDNKVNILYVHLSYKVNENSNQRLNICQIYKNYILSI